MTATLLRRTRAFVRRVGGLLRPGEADRDVREELESHLQLHVDAEVRAGATPEEARRVALLKLGGLEATRLACRDRASFPAVEQLGRDLRLAARQLRRTPGFTATAVVVTTLGFGAATAIFALVDAALLLPLPYRAPHQLVDVAARTPDLPRSTLSYLDYLDWQRQTRTLAALDVYAGTGHMLRGSEGARAIRGTRVSVGFFRTLGVAPALGRDFAPGEDQPGAAAVAILTHGLWQASFGGRPDVLGQTILLSDLPHVVVGVLPAGFAYPSAGASEIWTPLQPRDCEFRRSCHNLQGLGRLREGASADQAQAELASIALGLERRHPDSNRGQGASLLPLADALAARVRPVLLALLGGACLLWVIAIVNVTSLLVLRAERRGHELAVRRALGASRLRLVGQFAAEGLVLVSIATAAGVVAAHWILGSAAPLVPPDMRSGMPYLETLALTPRVIAVSGLAGALALVVFVAAPVLRLPRSDAPAAMAGGARTTFSGWQRLGFTLAAIELAVAVVLLAGAGLLGRSLHQLLRVDLGFEPAGLAAMDLALPSPRFDTPERLVAAVRRLEAQVATVPGVLGVGVTSVQPVSFNGNTDWIRFVGRPWTGRHTEVNMRDVTQTYFGTLKAPLLRGRGLTDRDTASSPKVAVVNRTFAERYFPGDDAVGRQFGDTALTPSSIKTIVGVVENIREGPLDAEIWPAVYYPFAQNPDSSFSLIVRTADSSGSILPTLRAAVTRIEPDLGIVRETTLAASIGDSPTAYLQRSSAWIVGGFAAVAWLLGSIGLYGVIAYAVGQRTRELAVRMALGAERWSVYRLVMADAIRVTAIGLAGGLVAAVGAAVLARRLLFDTPPWDVPTLAAVSAGLAISALLASLLPARRAASVDPIAALRAD